MNQSDIRAEWNELRARLSAEAIATKSSEEAVIELSAHYRRLDAQDQAAVDEVIAEWVNSDDESAHYDARPLIGEHHILAAVPALQRLIQRLAQSEEPGARFERAAVARVLSTLVSLPS
jgi:hypothetical protein